MLDQALFSKTTALFKDYCWAERYSTTAETYSTFNFDEHTAQFRFDRLKFDQVLPVSIFVWSVGIGSDRSNNSNALKTTMARANTTTAAAAVTAVAIEQQRHLLSLLISLKIINCLSITVPPSS